MRTAVFKGEKTIADLVTRIFPGVTGAPAKRQPVTEALLAANPQLANLSAVQPGAKIVVPTTVLPPDPAETTAVTAPAPAGRGNLFLYQHLEALKTAIPAATAAAAASVNANLAVMQRAEVQAAAAKDPKVAQRVAAATQRANSRIQAAQTLQAQFLQSIGPMQATLMKPITPAKSS
jgi:hypothetical protein